MDKQKFIPTTPLRSDLLCLSHGVSSWSPESFKEKPDPSKVYGLCR